ncbi:MAG: hypothetical protein SYC29_09585 [Planctomycetota bacterium]|nr:hypothetical protein [Planctomycetota bacterium]
MMADIKDPRIICVKGALFVLLGALAVTAILLESPNWRVAALLILAIWAFCRAYYFAFYVIQHYIDPAYRFEGLISFVRYLLRRRR